MYAHSQPRAVAITAMLTAMAILSAAACGGSRGTTRTDSRDAASADPVVSPAPAPVVSTGMTADPNVSYATAESAYTSHRYTDAVVMFSNYAARHPQNVWGHYMRGVSAWKAGQLDTARAAFETALAIDPGHTKSLINLSRVLLEQKRPNDALDRIDVVLAADSTSGEAWRVLGRVQSSLGHRTEALTAYRAAIALDSADVWSMNNMGLLLIGGGQYADALAPLARAVQLDSGVSVFHNNLGIALERSGHMAAAASAYQDALNGDSTYTKARVSLARVTGRQDEPGTEPVDVAALGTQFAAEISDWRAGRDVETSAACDSTTPAATPVTGASGSGGGNTTGNTPGNSAGQTHDQPNTPTPADTPAPKP
jgi:predicted Zn-dependent protease